MWNDSIRQQLIATNGSVQSISNLEDKIKRLYKTVWEIPQKSLINLSRSRAPYICQSQSLNIYMAEPSYSKLSSSHFYSWQLGLKTGQYYLRSKPARDAIKFTLNVESLMKTGCKESQIFNHMNYNNKSQAEMDKKKHKKRKLNAINKSEPLN